MLDEVRLKEDEYEKQYYGFSSTELYEDFKEQVSRAVKVSLKEMKEAFNEKQCSEMLGNEELAQLYTCYMESAKLPLQKFKDEVIKIFAIPKNVILVEDEYNMEQYSDEDIIKLKKEVAELEKEYLRERVFLAKCKQYKEIMDTTIKPINESINSKIKFLKNMPEHEQEKKIIDLHEKYVQYYCNNENTEAERDGEVERDCEVERNFIKNVDDFFK